MSRRPKSFDVVTLPYPGLATDLQPQAIALLSIADGTSMITENLFEARFMFCDELARMGANVRTDGHHAVVRGRERLSGAPVRATDIRAGVGLVIAALVADGVTEVGDVHHIDRGYVRIEEQLRALGAEVERVDLPRSQVSASRRLSTTRGAVVIAGEDEDVYPAVVATGQRAADSRLAQASVCLRGVGRVHRSRVPPTSRPSLRGRRRR